jgi:methylase of polypeptide subunit release factors
LIALPRYLKMGGHVLCEIGSKLQSERMEKMLQSIGLMAETKKDLSGRERVIIGSWINS